MNNTECNTPVGYAFVPIQKAIETNLYDAETGLMRGTIFPPIDLPLGVYGKQIDVKEETPNE